MNEFRSSSNDMDKSRTKLLRILKRFGVDSQFKRHIIADILLGSPSFNDLPKCPDVTKELFIAFFVWRSTSEKFVFSEFISDLQLVIEISDGEKAEQFAEFIEAIDSEYGLQSLIDDPTKDLDSPPDVSQ